jgi:hypothetical protein
MLLRGAVCTGAACRSVVRVRLRPPEGLVFEGGSRPGARPPIRHRSGDIAVPEAGVRLAVTVHGPRASVPASWGPWVRRARGERVARDDLIQATGSVDKVLGGGRYQITLGPGGSLSL